MKVFLFVLNCLFLWSQINGYPVWDEQQQILKDKTFPNIVYSDLTDKDLLGALVKTDTEAWKQLRKDLVSLCENVNACWNQFQKTIQKLLDENTNCCVLKNRILLGKKLQKILTDFWGQPVSEISLITAIWIYNIPYAQEDLKTNIDIYLNSFMEM